MNKQDIDKNVTKRQVIILRNKFNIGYNFVLFLYLKQKSLGQVLQLGKVTSVGANLCHIQVCR